MFTDYLRLARLDTIEFTMDMIKATSIAVPNPDTSIPSMSVAKMLITAPLMTKENSPKVKSVIGNDSI